jgi:hypothetical protein
MPNHCYNVLKISNDDINKIDALDKAIKNGDGLFQHLRPNPDGENADNWYEWNRENWGTKWDVRKNENCNCDIISYDRDDDILSMSFDTAWCPPIELYNFLHEKGWIIEAYYIEEGDDFMGMYIDGEDTDYNVSEITNKNYFDKLPQDLVDALDLKEIREERLEQMKEEEEEEDNKCESCGDNSNSTFVHPFGNIALCDNCGKNQCPEYKHGKDKLEPCEVCFPESDDKKSDDE